MIMKLSRRDGKQQCTSIPCDASSLTATKYYDIHAIAKIDTKENTHSFKLCGEPST